MGQSSRPDYPYALPPRLPEDDSVDLDTLLAGDGPIEIEIGPGRGAFIVERCGQHPEVRMLGIEMRRKWAQRVDERLAKRSWSARARVVCEDARQALPRLEPEASVARVFIHFPDPWWKKRHQKRMLIGDALVTEIARLLQDGGELFVQTDVPERAEQYRAIIGGQPSLMPAGDEPGSSILATNPYGALGNRERRAERDGLPVQRLRYRRRARATSSEC